jgi:hypothetical protein
MGRAPLGKIEDSKPIKIWCINSGLTKLSDFSTWDENGKQIKWKIFSPPVHILPLLSKIYNHLAGCAPIEAQLKDT